MTDKVKKVPKIPPFYADEIGRIGYMRTREGKTLLPMNFGQPTAGAPAAAIEVAHRMLDHDPLGYFESEPLRERLSQHYRDRYGVEVEPRRILLTTGASTALVTAFACLFRTGDRVAIVVPGYPAYRNTLTALHLHPLELRCCAENGFRPTAGMLASLDPAPAGFVLASPANPTGAMLDEQGMADMVAVCAERGITLISDEIYHGITYGKPAVSALQFDPNVLVINSFSKLYRMPGWRLGWMVVPSAWVENFSNYLINMFLTPPTLAQFAALAALDETEDLYRWIDIYRENREQLMAGLADMGITAIAPPDGAFYLYADLGHITQDSLQFCTRAVEDIGVALAPGIDFDLELGHRFVRFSFAVKPEQIQQAIELLAQWLPDYRDHPD